MSQPIPILSGSQSVHRNESGASLLVTVGYLGDDGDSAKLKTDSKIVSIRGYGFVSFTVGDGEAIEVTGISSTERFKVWIESVKPA